MTTKEIAAHCGVTAAAIKKLAKEGKISFTQVTPKRWDFEPETVSGEIEQLKADGMKFRKPKDTAADQADPLDEEVEKLQNEALKAGARASGQYLLIAAADAREAEKYLLEARLMHAYADILTEMHSVEALQ